MKKIVIYFKRGLNAVIVLCFCLTLFGCSGNTSAPEKEAKTEINVNNTIENSNPNATYSKVDESIIAEAIKNAEVLAEAGDYDAALKIIINALDSYPDSKALLYKKADYEEMLNILSYEPDPEETIDIEPSSHLSEKEPFFGIWCLGTKSKAEAKEYKKTLQNEGYDAKVCVTTDWSELNSEKWYVVTAGVYPNEEWASSDLEAVRKICPNAYIKYSGDYIGESKEKASIEPFYGIWCIGAKNRSDAKKSVENLKGYGYDAKVYVTTDWSNLNSEKWYVVSAGEYSTKDEAEEYLEDIQELYESAYIKYTGEYQGSK